MLNLILKMKETTLFFLIVIINGLICIDSDISLDTCAKGGEGRKCFFHYYRVCTNKTKWKEKWREILGLTILQYKDYYQGNEKWF